MKAKAKVSSSSGRSTWESDLRGSGFNRNMFSILRSTVLEKEYYCIELAKSQAFHKGPKIMIDMVTW